MITYRPPSVSALLALAALSICSAEASQTFWVGNNGTDSAACGNRATPCRSIGQAITNAAAGDSIAVGAGIYGDLSGDGTFSHPGDEHPRLIENVIDTNVYNGCIICVTKPLTIQSLHGASVTFIRGAPLSGYPATVQQIASTGVIFGTDGNGFTITGGNSWGVLVDQDYLGPVQKNIVVQGNVDLNDGTGFYFSGQDFSDRPCPDPHCFSTATVFFLNNQSSGNPGDGFVAVNNAYRGSLVIRNNLARNDAGSGFVVAPGTQTITGTSLGDFNVSLTQNVSINNGGYGFDTAQPGGLRENTAIGNKLGGFLVIPGGPAQYDSAIGNGGPGLTLQDSADFTDIGEISQGGPEIVVTGYTHDNFYGNDRYRPQTTLYTPDSLTHYDPGPSAHCGILNVGKIAWAFHSDGSGPPPTVTLQATNNFWGAARGPAASGPGDAAGGACDQNGGVTTVKPFATATPGITTAS